MGRKVKRQKEGRLELGFLIIIFISRFLLELSLVGFHVINKWA